MSRFFIGCGLSFFHRIFGAVHGILNLGCRGVGVPSQFTFRIISDRSCVGEVNQRLKRFPGCLIRVLLLLRQLLGGLLGGILSCFGAFLRLLDLLCCLSGLLRKSQHILSDGFPCLFNSGKQSRDGGIKFALHVCQIGFG